MSGVKSRLGFMAAAGLALAAGHAVGGPVDPPAGPVGPTMKTLQQVEPRVPLSLETTPGDNDSHFKITAAGSYYLTQNLAVSGKHVIEIASSNVTIDLNGFRISGASGGTFHGVHGSVSGLYGVTVRNGTVIGFSGNGVNLSGVRGARVEDITARSNAAIGVAVDDAGIIRNVVVEMNATGVNAGEHCVLENVAANQNSGNGIAAFAGSSLTNCAAGFNGSNGFNLFRCTVNGCNANENTLSGFILGSGTTITSSSAQGNDANGFVASTGCIITDCNAFSHPEAGFRLDTGNLLKGSSARLSTPGVRITANHNRVEGNHITQCAGGVDMTGGQFNLVVSNSVVNLTSGNPFSSPGNNRLGPVSATLSHEYGPWVNFAY